MEWVGQGVTMGKLGSKSSSTAASADRAPASPSRVTTPACSSSVADDGFSNTPARAFFGLDTVSWVPAESVGGSTRCGGRRAMPRVRHADRIAVVGRSLGIRSASSAMIRPATAVAECADPDGIDTPRHRRVGGCAVYGRRNRVLSDGSGFDGGHRTERPSIFYDVWPADYPSGLRARSGGFMSIRISSNTPDDEPGSTLLPVRDRIDEDLRTHPAVRLASEAVPVMHRTTAGERFGPVRLIERDSDVAVVFAADTTRWAVLVQPGGDSPKASLILGVPNPRVGFGRSFRASYLERLTVHQSGDPSSRGNHQSSDGWHWPESLPKACLGSK